MYDPLAEYREKQARAFAFAMDFEIAWGFDDMGLSKTAQEIKEATGSTAYLTDKRSWHGKWYHQNYDYYRKLLYEKLRSTKGGK